jgi:hypothetical protein
LNTTQFNAYANSEDMATAWIQSSSVSSASTRSDPFMNVVDPLAFSRRILELLKAGPEETLELSLLKNGKVLIGKTESERGMENAAPV